MDHYLVIDDGRADRTRAWIIPQLIGDSCELGDVVSMRVRRWTRRVKKVTVLQAVRPAPRAAEPSMKAVHPGGVVAGTLLTPEELSGAVGRQVRPDQATRYGDKGFANAHFNDLQGELAVPSASSTAGPPG